MRSARNSFLCMNTVVSNSAYGGAADKAVEDARLEALRLERLLSRFLPESDIARLNRAAGSERVRLSPEAFEVLTIGAECAEMTGGCFDMTVGPLVRLWTEAEQPDERSIAAARELTGLGALTLRRQGRAAGLAMPGQRVDLGGIGKGYAADRMLAVFRRRRVRSAFTDFGGNIALLGAKPDGSPWRVGIRHPGRQGGVAGVLLTENRSVVTSGDDQRAVRAADGSVHSHIVDQRTGRPAQSGLLSVTVAAASSAVADALATALFVAGLEEGLCILARFPGADAVFIDRDFQLFLTRSLADSFQAAEGIKTNVM